MILEAIHRIANQSQSLSRREARDVMAEVLAGNGTDAQIAALLVALRMKGETVEEIVGFAEAIRAAATPLPIPVAGEASISAALDLSGTGRDALVESAPADGGLVDTSGTGGDACGTFNISTATAFVTAGAGVRVAKHGNRSISSKCGSADVMEALGVSIQLTPERAAQCLREIGICFLYAPDLHSVHEASAEGTAGVADAHHVQPARSADESGACFGTSGWRICAGYGREAGRGSQYAGIASRAGGSRSGRA